MTLVVRRVGACRSYRKLGKAGPCVVGLGQIVGAWGAGPIRRVVWV
jgi:hypothetical protein